MLNEIPKGGRYSIKSLCPAEPGTRAVSLIEDGEGVLVFVYPVTLWAALEWMVDDEYGDPKAVGTIVGITSHGEYDLDIIETIDGKDSCIGYVHPKEEFTLRLHSILGNYDIEHKTIINSDTLPYN